jgi:hypothetical protein
MVEEAISLRDAVFWMNIHLNLLAGNQRALRRMRDLVTAGSRWPADYEPDFQLASGEAERLLKRIAYWEAVVDRANRAARLRPILAGFRGLDRRRRIHRRQERRIHSVPLKAVDGRTAGTDRRQHDRRQLV